MTDEELLISWTACDSRPEDAIACFRRRGSDRQWRLFAVACCQRIEQHFQDRRFQHAIDVAEKHADGAASDLELREAWKGADSAFDRLIDNRKVKADGPQRCAAAAAHWCSMLPSGKVVELACQAAFEARHATADPHREAHEQAYLLQDVFGGKNPSVKLDPAWRTSSVVALANGIYEERAFDRMPILADALEEAGCENKRILSHCRDPKGRHTRGCWVVDKILEKK